MTYKARRRWALFILLIGLPVYIGVVVGVMGLVYDRFGQLPVWLDLSIYVILGIACFLPFKNVFKGVGRADPDAPPED